MINAIGAVTMNRNNIWIHIGLAVILIAMAAVIGQIRRWENTLRSARTMQDEAVKTRPTTLKRSA